MDNWEFVYHQWDQYDEPIRETLCVLGNGYFATRGAAEESFADEIHYPGTYLAGGYNRLKSDIYGKIIESEDLVNFPNFLCLTFKVAEETDWFKLEETEIISFLQTLDIKQGILKRVLRFRDKKNRETTLKTFRIVSLDNPHLAAIRWELTPENWSGKITVRSGLDGSVANHGVKRYRQLNSKHLNIVDLGIIAEDCIFLLVQTNQSRLYMAQTARTRVYEGDLPKAAVRTTSKENERIFQELTFLVQKHSQITIEKTVSIYTSLDHACSEPLIAAHNAIIHAENFEILLKKHAEKWRRTWDRFNMKIDAGGDSELFCHLHLFHFLQTCSVHTIDMDVGVPARGWHGEAYRGHVFWDELFIFPLLNFHAPDLTRSLLLYRYRRLPQARNAAYKAGFKGSMFPWQSGSDGREESQIFHLNPNTNLWVPDKTYLQRHVNAAIAYNIWQYFEVTFDLTFMHYFGAEMLLEIARFLSSLTQYNANLDKFEIKGVVGPDEFHTAYSGSDASGIDNNAYTNLMTVWVLMHTQKILKSIDSHRRKELLHKLEISHDELKRWDEISRKMYIPMTDSGIILQFDGYDRLLELDMDFYRKKYGNIERLDRILDAEGDSVNRYKVTKQPDVLMLFYLFSHEELKILFKHLDYDYVSKCDIKKHIEYYAPHTTLGSSLSQIVNSWVTACCDREQAWKYFYESLKSDFEEGKNSTTSEGIHLGSLAGAIDIIQRGFTGLVIRNNVLWLNPLFPKELKNFEFKLNYRGCWLQLSVSHRYLTVFFERGIRKKIKFGFRKKIFTLVIGETKEFKLN